MIKTRVAYALATLAGLVLVTGCNSSKVADVSGDSVTKDEFLEELQTMPTVRVVDSQGRKGQANVPPGETLAFQAMQNLVTRKIVLQMAKDEGVAPTDKEVDAEIEFRKKLSPGYIKDLQSKGYTLQGIRNMVQFSLAQERLLTKGVTVSDADVDKFIADNKASFDDGPYANLLWIYCKTPEKKDQVQKALDTGMMFKMAARQYSEAPNAAATDGAFFGGMSDRTKGSDLRKLTPELRTMIENTEAGKPTDWINADQGYVKFFVNSKTAKKSLLPLAPEKKEMLRRQLAIKRGADANDLNKRVADKLQNAKIDISDPSLKEMWSQFEEQLKQLAKETKLPDASGSSQGLSNPTTPPETDSTGAGASPSGTPAPTGGTAPAATTGGTAPAGG